MMAINNLLDVFFATLEVHCDKCVVVWHEKVRAGPEEGLEVGLVVTPGAAHLGGLSHYFEGRMWTVRENDLN